MTLGTVKKLKGGPTLLWWPAGGANPPLTRGRRTFAFRLGSVTNWGEICLLRTVRAEASG